MRRNAKRCVELADRDMMSGGRFVCKDFFALKNKTDRVSFILQELNANGFDYSKVDKRKISEAVFWKCDEQRIKRINGFDRSFKPFGLAQKLVNMTYKYLYTYRDHINIQIDFSKCECPVDSVIINERLGRSEKWTDITFEEYEDIRKSIESALKDEKYSEMKAEIGALAFDDNWVNLGG